MRARALWRIHGLWIAVLAWALVAGVPATARAHATLTSSVALDVRDDGVDADLKLPLDQLGLALHLDLSDARAVLPRESDRLRAYLPAHLGITDADGRAFAADVRELSVKEVDGADYLVARLSLRAPEGASRRWLTLHDDLILHQVVTHHILVSVRRDFEQALFGREPKILGVLTYAQTEVAVPREGASAWRGFRAMVALGRRHIADGADHLLFLLVLLLPAPLAASRGRWTGQRGLGDTVRAILVIVTSFTVGHSISLALGTVGWVVVPARPVEVAIACSILVTAAHAFRPLFARREPVVGLVFGLVHGLAFASALEELGVRGSNLALSLLGFNLGIEAMQLAVVIAFVPWLVLLARTRWYPALRVTGAVLAAVAATGWAIERMTGSDDGTARAGGGLAHAPIAALLVVMVAIAATTARRFRASSSAGAAAGKIARG